MSDRSPSAIATADPERPDRLFANYGSDTVTPIEEATNRAGQPIPAGYAPNSLAVTLDGSHLYVVDGNADQVTPIATGTSRPGRAIKVGYSPVAIAAQAEQPRTW